MDIVFLTYLFRHLQLVSNTKSSSIRVLDGDEFYRDGSDLPQTATTIMCSNTKFCDGFPSDETIVDQFFKPFDAPTCTASLDC